MKDLRYRPDSLAFGREVDAYCGIRFDADDCQVCQLEPAGERFFLGELPVCSRCLEILDEAGQLEDARPDDPRIVLYERACRLIDEARGGGR